MTNTNLTIAQRTEARFQAKKLLLLKDWELKNQLDSEVKDIDLKVGAYVEEIKLSMKKMKDETNEYSQIPVLLKELRSGVLFSKKVIGIHKELEEKMSWIKIENKDFHELYSLMEVMKVEINMLKLKLEIIKEVHGKEMTATHLSKVSFVSSVISEAMESIAIIMRNNEKLIETIFPMVV